MTAIAATVAVLASAAFAAGAGPVAATPDVTEAVPGGARCAAVRLPAATTSLPETHSIGVYDAGGTMVGNYPGAYAVSPDGTKVARVAAFGGTLRIELADADGGNVRTVYTFPNTSSSSERRRMVFSSTGQHLAFLNPNRLGGSQDSLVVLELGATPVVRLETTFEVLDDGFDFSPDGSKIAYIEAGGVYRGYDIWIANADGSGSPNRIMDVTALDSSLPPFNPPKAAQGITWSPDGTQLAFAARRGDPTAGELYVVNANGSNRREVAGSAVPNSSQRVPSWSPDGTRIAYAFSSSPGVRRIDVVDVATDAVTPVPGATWQDSDPPIVWLGSSTIVYDDRKLDSQGQPYFFAVTGVDGSGRRELQFPSKPINSMTVIGTVPCDAAPSAALTSIQPGRVLDTRVPSETIDGQFQGIGVRRAGSTTAMRIAGRAGIPAGAESVMFNVTAIGPEGPGFITVWPCGTARPLASNLNYSAGAVVANAVISKVSETGDVCIVTSSATELAIDVSGYVVRGGSPTTVVPARLLETRPGQTSVDGQFQGIGRQPAGATVELTVAGRGGVPADATAVMLNVTAVLPDGPGFLTVWSCGDIRPVASSVNYGPGSVVPNAVLAKVGTGGKVCIYTSSAADILADVNGYVVGAGSPAPVVPARLLETRPGQTTVDGQFQGIGRQPANATVELTVAGRGGVPGDATAVMLNVTAVFPGGPGFLTVWPCGQPRPLASSVNYGPGSVVPNAVLAKVGTGGRVCIYTLAPADILADVNGYVVD